MELLFNELSIIPYSKDETGLAEKMLSLIDTIKMAKDKGARKIRSENRLEQIYLTANLSVQDWLLRPENRRYMDFLNGMFIHPFLDLDNEPAFIKYDNAKYTFQDEECEISEECLGLAAAYIYELPAVSFSGFPLWERPNLTITIEIDANIRFEQVMNIARGERFNEQDFLDFSENYGDLILPTTDVLPKNKSYHLATHHGVAELTVLCKQLINSPYVVEMRSMEWCRGKCNKFIKNFYKNGVIEIVLIQTQKKYGLWVQTTGINYRQTKAIADILEERYS